MWYPGRRLVTIGDAVIDYASGSLLIRHLLPLLTLTCALSLSVPMAAIAAQTASPEERMAGLVNQARRAQGLNPLAINPQLTAAALAHARDMVAQGYMEHEGRNGSTPQQRAVLHGYAVPPRSAWMVVEVISARPTAEAAADWLLTDRVHRGVLLRPTWREMGIAFVKGGPYGQFWTIEFGCQPNVLPLHTEPTAGGMTVRLTNEDCAPGGGTAEQIGRATEMLISDKKDLTGATWEPFSATKSLPWSGNVFVKLRDSRGREALSAAGTGSATVTAATVDPPTEVPASSTPPLVQPTPSGLFEPVPGVR